MNRKMQRPDAVKDTIGQAFPEEANRVASSGVTMGMLFGKEGLVV